MDDWTSDEDGFTKKYSTPTQSVLLEYPLHDWTLGCPALASRPVQIARLAPEYS
jgi:hypothetical protein